MAEKENRDCIREAYLDIETTGLSPSECDITVVGVLVDGIYHGLVCDFDLTPEALHYVLQDVDVVYTFNGKRFDVPFIRKKLGSELYAEHVDLLYECRREGLRGGQKIVEQILCISRGGECTDGRTAARLGKKWLFHRDLDALDILLRYNEEDLRNLRHIKLHIEACRKKKEAMEKEKTTQS